MAFAELELVPSSGAVDRALVESRLRDIATAFVDPWDPSCWFVSSSAEIAGLRLEARRADRSRRPYALLVLLEPERLWIIGEFADRDERSLVLPLVRELCATGAWRARDAAYGGEWRDPPSFFET